MPQNRSFAAFYSYSRFRKNWSFSSWCYL